MLLFSLVNCVCCLRLWFFRLQGRRGGGGGGGDNTSDEEFERQLEEAEAIQEEEQKRRHHKRGGKRSAGGRPIGAAAVAAAAVASSSMHVSASAPNLSRKMKKTGIARVPLMGGTRQALPGEDGYETDHQDYCDVCQQVSHPHFIK